MLIIDFVGKVFDVHTTTCLDNIFIGYSYSLFSLKLLLPIRGSLMTALFTGFLWSQPGKSHCCWGKIYLLRFKQPPMFLRPFLSLHSLTVFSIFLKGKTITTLDMKDMEAACHFITLMDIFLLLKSKIKSVLKTKLSNLLSKKHSTILAMNL